MAGAMDESIMLDALGLARFCLKSNDLSESCRYAVLGLSRFCLESDDSDLARQVLEIVQGLLIKGDSLVASGNVWNSAISDWELSKQTTASGTIKVHYVYRKLGIENGDVYLQNSNPSDEEILAHIKADYVLQKALTMDSLIQGLKKDLRASGGFGF